MPEVCHLLYGGIAKSELTKASGMQQRQQGLNEDEAVCSVPGAYTPPLSMKDCRIYVLFAFPALTSLRHVM